MSQAGRDFRTLGRALSIAGVAAASLLLLLGAAHAQPVPAAPPPVRSTIDGNGVDLIALSVSVSETPLSIGEAGASRMVYVRKVARGGDASNLDGYVDLVAGEGSTRVVVGDRDRKSVV